MYIDGLHAVARGLPSHCRLPGGALLKNEVMGRALLRRSAAAAAASALPPLPWLLLLPLRAFFAPPPCCSAGRSSCRCAICGGGRSGVQWRVVRPVQTWLAALQQTTPFNSKACRGTTAHTHPLALSHTAAHPHSAVAVAALVGSGHSALAVRPAADVPPALNA